MPVYRPYPHPQGGLDIAPLISEGGTPTINPSGIGSAEAFGTPTITTGAVTVSPTGIASAEAFGTAQINLTIFPTSTASAEAFGTAQVNLKIFPNGIASAGAFGTATITTGAVTISPSGIASVEVFGTAVITQGGGAQTVSPSSIGTAEAFGTAVVTTGVVTISPSGIASTEAFGNAIVTGGAAPAVTEAIIESFMTATVTMSTTGESLWDLIQDAVGTFPPITGDRVADVQIQHRSGTFHLVYKSGSVNVATDSGYQFVTGRHLNFLSPVANELSLKEIYLAGTVGGEQAGIIVHII